MIDRLPIIGDIFDRGPGADAGNWVCAANPAKGGGLLFMIDGGISKAYQKQTGIGGYTFIYNSRYLALAENQPLKPGTLIGTDSPTIMVVEAIKKESRSPIRIQGGISPPKLTN